jgi:hypothetical protein
MNIKVKIEWGKKGKHFAMDEDTLKYELNKWAMQNDYFEVTNLETGRKAHKWRKVVI